MLLYDGHMIFTEDDNYLPTSKIASEKRLKLTSEPGKQA